MKYRPHPTRLDLFEINQAIYEIEQAHARRSARGKALSAAGTQRLAALKQQRQRLIEPLKFEVREDPRQAEARRELSIPSRRRSHVPMLAAMLLASTAITPHRR